MQRPATPPVPMGTCLGAAAQQPADDCICYWSGSPGVQLSRLFLSETSQSVSHEEQNSERRRPLCVRVVWVAPHPLRQEEQWTGWAAYSYSPTYSIRHDVAAVASADAAGVHVDACMPHGWLSPRWW